eukprot:NODE_423_length_1967_cov_62.454348_g416_i0.p1 GENE.NODE_423_length_1967_cov_62.454348_g416_i0~~NODE_423_length_1967_cov_62.454348_g416_i0.p1  ORF type:complete len:601 (+),score=159.71 NODE_423_length_1967_cov_62.454348_g416_i0:65-1867(+)
MADITTSLIQEIVSQCQKKGFVVSPQLAAFFVKTKLVAVEQDETGAIELTAGQVENLVKLAVERLTRSDDPGLESFKMQAAVLSQQQDAVNQQRTDLIQHRAKTQQLLQEVVAKMDHNKVFGDIVLYILHETGLYSSKNELVQKETMTALESVIPREAIESFISQHENEKIKQMDELWKIVWGIRLFNRETNKGGAGIPDLPGELANMTTSAQALLQQQQEAVAQTADHYFAVLDHVPSLDEASKQRLGDEYHNRKVYLQSAAKLSKTVNAIAGQLATTRPSYDTLVNGVRDMVTSTNSVPKSVIYPRFIEISEKWDTFKKLHQEMKDAKRLVDLLCAYQNSYTQTLKPSLVEEAMKLKETSSGPQVNAVLLEQEVNRMGPGNKGCFYTQNIPPTVPPQFSGYCPNTLVDDGLLMPGVDAVGFIRYGEQYFTFRTAEMLKQFVEAPEKYIDGIVSCDGVLSCGLLSLLGLESRLPSEIYLHGTRQKNPTVVEVTKCDADTQTGQIDAYKDYKYEWNEWELRRLALQLADLRNKRTHSCQTDLSHFKRDNDTQTFPKRESGQQTLVDQATQGKHHVQYVQGLRGKPLKHGAVKVAKMTFDE